MAPFHATFENPSAIPARGEAGLYLDHGPRSLGSTAGVSSAGLDARPETIIRWLVGLVLIAAAILKAVGLVTEPALQIATGRTLLSLVLRGSPDPALVLRGSPDPALLGTILLSLQIGLELGLGLFALTGFYWRQLRWLAAMLFTGFAAYSLYWATRGATSCGCFGPLEIHPWWTFGLDLTILLALLLPSRLLTPDTRHLTPSSSSIKHPASSIQFVTAIIAVSLLTTAFLVRYTSEKTTAAAGVLTTSSGLMILDPEQWIGKQLPISEFIDFAPGSGSFFAQPNSAPQESSAAKKVPDPFEPADLMQGHWIILLHRHDCPACQEVLPHYEQLARQGSDTFFAQQNAAPQKTSAAKKVSDPLSSEPTHVLTDPPTNPNIALIEVPPFGPSNQHLIKDSTRRTPESRSKIRPGEHLLTSARLSADHERFVETPTEITLERGIVTAVHKPGYDPPRRVPVRDWERSFDPASGASVPAPNHRHAQELPASP